VDASVARSLLGVAMLAVVACDGEDAPPVVRAHDEVMGPVAVEMPTTQAQPTDDTPDASTDSPYGTFDDGGYVRGYAVSPIQVCKQCACEAGTYCFGGGTGYTTFDGTCTAGSTLGVGCQPLPTACATKPTCDCLFDALKANVHCYLVCSGTDDLIAYCPNP
jgi:hypothetical protein